ncbi:MAG TPA: FAD:protein FMN transferase [Solirubrobacteraceae bacterium]|nr:FAD:protein FMN transferase [Solirubrobacteraceae bacterium]
MPGVAVADRPTVAADAVTARWEALGTSVVVRVADPTGLEPAVAAVEAELSAIDAAASRFRADSDLERLNAAGGRWVDVSPLLIDALDAGIRAAELTDGAVDPTLGDALLLAGYTTDWRELGRPPRDGPRRPPRPLVVRVRQTRAWEQIELRRTPPAARLGGGIRVDLGATAKALAADRAAIAAATAAGVGVGVGVLVSLGGDIATGGSPPVGGWQVHVTDDHRSSPTAPGQTIGLASGGLATSSTTVRRWSRAGQTMHHILDPRDGRPVDRTWRTASVAAATCIDANIASTASIVLGSAAADWLADRGLPARLVARDGRVETVGDWPTDGWPA